MSDNKKSIIKQLKINKDYNQIYKLYGQAEFLKHATIKFKKADLKKLIDEKKYFEIYDKYGESKYNEYLENFMKNDIINELGVKPRFINFLFFQKLKKNLKLTLFGLGVIAMSVPSIIQYSFDSITFSNEKKYAYELELYNNEIEEYAKYINSLNLSNLEIIVKVMSDMWGSIDGYKTPESYDDIGALRLSNYINNYGVCRNFADDVAHRLNAINSSYNACVLSTYIDKAEVNKIERNIIESNNTVSNEETSNQKDETNKFIGNHAVVCLYLKEENLILIVDPTNPSIGILKDGKIEMFSDKAKDGMVSTPLSDFVFSGVEGYKKILQSYISNDNYDEFKIQFDVDAQNKALENIEDFENNYKK